MARLNEILSGRFNRALQKLTSIKGGPPAAQLSTEIQPSLPFFSGVENRYLESWNLFSTAFLVTANAANISQFRLTNDFGTNVIAVLEKLLISTSIAQEVDITQVNYQVLVGGHVPDLTTQATFALDARQGNPQNVAPQAVIHASSSNVTNSNANIVGRVQLLANTPFDLISDELGGDWPLLPQTLFQVQNTVANAALVGWVRWRERFLEDSERA
jgi:hypothetical protein